MVLGGSVRVQRHRHRHSGNLKVTNGPTNQLTVVGSGDAYTSKKNLEMLKYFASGCFQKISHIDAFDKRCCVCAKVLKLLATSLTLIKYHGT